MVSLFVLARREFGVIVSTGLFSLLLVLFKPAVEIVGRSPQSPVRRLTENPNWLNLLDRRLSVLGSTLSSILVPWRSLPRQQKHQIKEKTAPTMITATRTKTPTTFPVSEKKPPGAVDFAWTVIDATAGAVGVMVTVCTSPVIVTTDAYGVVSHEVVGIMVVEGAGVMVGEAGSVDGELTGATYI
jgi:hypothetical protein